MTKIRIAGLDGSKTNFGIAIMELDIDTLELKVLNLHLVKTEKSKNKQVRASSDNLQRCQTISEAVFAQLHGCTAAFMEVPTGAQSAAAAMAFGMVIGIYSTIEPMLGVPTIEVSPAETKLAAVGTRTASKDEMIDWAREKFPGAPWLMRKSKGALVPTNDNEHLADAVAIVHAGIRTPAFKTVIAMLKASSAKAA